jgi:Endomembrane protein 70
MYFDDLPIWGFVGKIEKNIHTSALSYFLFTHFHFDVFYNGDRIIEVRVSADPTRAVDITADAPAEADFSYSVKWRTTTTTVRCAVVKPDHQRRHGAAVVQLHHMISAAWYSKRALLGAVYVSRQAALHSWRDVTRAASMRCMADCALAWVPVPRAMC